MLPRAGMLSMKIKQIVEETADVMTLVFEPLVQGWHYVPGQFVTLKLWVNDAYVHRSYSFCTTPYTDLYPAITIKRVKGGLVSSLLHSDVREGMVLEALPPTGRFVLPPQGHERRHLILIAGGVGIAPLFSILKGALACEPQTTISLIYANRDEESIIYRAALAALAKRYPARLKVVHVLSHPSMLWRGYRGRLMPSSLRTLLREVRSGRATHYFLCAPRGLMDMARQVLLRVGVSPRDIHQEHFSLPTAQQRQGTFTYALKVDYLGRVYRGSYASDKTLLEAALAAGADVPYACMRGRCNTCSARCVEGEVVMDEDEGLTEEELKEGYVLTCVARPRTSKIRLLM